MSESCDARIGVSLSYLADLLGSAEVERIASQFPEPHLSPTGLGATIDYVTAWKILNASVEQGQDEGHRIFNEAIPSGNFQLLVASLLQGSTLVEGLRQMAAGARILRPDLAFTVSVNAGHPHLSIRFISSVSAAKAVYLEALLVVIHCAIQWGIGGPIIPARICGPALVATAKGSLLHVLGRHIRREGDGVVLVYEAKLADAPFVGRHFARWHDGAFAEYVKLVDQMLEDELETDQVEKIAKRVRGCLLQGLKSQDTIAHHLGMSVATLRRRLNEEGASFRSIVGDIRRDAAEILLLGDKSAEAIAAELGLSDSRCFRRACKTWFGAAPSEVRRSFRADDQKPRGMIASPSTV